MRYVWDPFVRIFHWSLVVAFAIAFLTHESEWHRVIHVNAGYTAGTLIVARIIWGLMKTGYASFHAFPFNPLHAARYVWQILRGSARPTIGHNPAGSFIIYALLGTGLLTVATGFLVYNDGWLIDDPELLQALHFYAAWGWLVLIATHVTGVITESILHRENLIYAMFTGIKHDVENSERCEDDENVSRETLNVFARWTMGLKRIYKTYIAINSANKKMYRIIEDNDAVNTFGVQQEGDGKSVDENLDNEIAVKPETTANQNNKN